MSTGVDEVDSFCVVVPFVSLHVDYGDYYQPSEKKLVAMSYIQQVNCFIAFFHSLTNVCHESVSMRR